MTDNNSTINISPTISCGPGYFCNSSLVCFAAPEGPICGDTNGNLTTYNWKLNPTVFPPIEYIGNKIGGKSKDYCEIFSYNLWSDVNKNWLLTFFYQNWNSNNTTDLPLGSFARPLDYIGSCSNIVETSNDISLQQLYCDYDNKCKKKINSPKVNCISSNQCLSELCGTLKPNQPIDGNITSMEGMLCNNDFTTYDQLRGGRAFNVKPVGDDINNDENNNNNNDANNNKDSSGSMAVIIIILIILFASMAVYGYARRIFKKRDNSEDDTHYLRREIDPETGEIVTVNTLGGRVRRGASMLLNRGGGLNRSNSIRTLPPYTVMDEERPQSTSNGGIVNSITQFFFPPGELPPPYDSIAENVNYNNSDTTIHDVTLDEVREGVIIEGNDNNNNNNNSPPPSRRTSLRSTTSRRDDDDNDDDSHPRELSIISEVISEEVTVDNSEGDKAEVDNSEVDNSVEVDKVEVDKVEVDNSEVDKAEVDKVEVDNSEVDKVEVEVVDKVEEGESGPNLSDNT